MTEFEIIQTLNTTPELYWKRIHESDQYLHYMYIENLGFEYEVLEADFKRGIRRIRVTPEVRVPEVIMKLAGGQRSFVEEGVLESDGVYRFRVIPAKFADRISVTGELHLSADGDSHCTRRTIFFVDARFPGLSGLIERTIERSTRSSYAKGLEWTNRYIANYAAARQLAGASVAASG